MKLAKILKNLVLGIARAWRDRREPFPPGTEVEFRTTVGSCRAGRAREAPYPAARRLRGLVIDRASALALEDPGPGGWRNCVPVAAEDGGVWFIRDDLIAPVKPHWISGSIVPAG